MSSIINHANRVHIQDQPWSVLDLVTEYSPENDGTIIVPDGQREWAWKSKKGLRKQQNLINSVFYGFPIPSIILNKKSRVHLEVYDGRHRIETLWRYYKDKFTWEGKKYSELCVEDQRIFCERTLPATIIQNASNEQLADMFIRLNAGVPLKDYDLLWAQRNSTLVRATRRLICENARFATALGGADLSYRPDLANWTAFVAGLSTWNSGNMTTSYIRLSGDDGLGLEMNIQTDRVVMGMDAFCALLESIPSATPKQLRKMKKIGKFAAFFLHEWMAAEDKAPIFAKWRDVLRRLWGGEDVAKPMAMALSTTGAQNLTSTKISETLAQVNAYLTGLAPPHVSASDDSDSDDSD